MTHKIHHFSFPTLILFGAGARHELAAHLAAQDLKRPLIVTDRGIARLPMLSEMNFELKNAGFHPAIFSEVFGNPGKSQVEAGTLAFHAHGADSIVGLGGGAALDVAKAIAVMAHHPGDLFDYEDEKPGARPLDAEIPYFVAVPTTAGTGSEVGRSAVISDDVTHLKKIIFSPRLLAKAVFADPELTLELPRTLTIATGMDALTHCVEAFLASAYHPICDAIALEGFRLAATNLPRAVHAPHDIEARANMLMASMMGAIAFQKGLGLTHSCAHALGTVSNMHHGFANGVMIDFALRHNLQCSNERLRELARVAGIRDGDGESFLTWLSALKADLGLPRGLGEPHSSRKDLGRLADVAYADSCHQNNPRPVSRDDFFAIFEAAFNAGAATGTGEGTAA